MNAKVFLAVSIGFSTGFAALPAQSPANDVLEIFSIPSNTTGMIHSYWADYIEQQIGARIELVSPGGTKDNRKKLQILMASNSLPDLVALEPKDFELAAQQGMLLDLSPLLPAYGRDIVNNGPKAIQYVKDVFGGPQHAVYGIPANIGASDGRNTLNFGPYIRWDLYRKIGMPTVSSLEDLLVVFKKIQALEPRNEKGLKTYPLSLWTDWDSLGAFHAEVFGALFGQDILQGWFNLLFVVVDVPARKLTNALQKDGMYFRTLKFFFDANKAGLLDPDSLTQRWDTALQKMREGRISFSIWPWFGQSYNTDERIKAGKGFALLPIKGSAVFKRGNNPLGFNHYWAISKTSTHSEKALQYLNLLYNPDAVLNLCYGPRGQYWDVGPDGVARHTELGWEMKDNDREFPVGGRPSRREGISIVNAFGISPNTVSPTYKVAAGNDSEWPDALKRPSGSIDADWRAVTKSSTAVEFLAKTNASVDFPWWASLVEIPPNDINDMAQRISRIVKYNSWQMIYARNVSEFNQLRDDMISKANELGLQKVLDWGMAAYARAEEKARRYQ